MTDKCPDFGNFGEPERKPYAEATNIKRGQTRKSIYELEEKLRLKRELDGTD
jgi:hypothetical protein